MILSSSVLSGRALELHHCQISLGVDSSCAGGAHCSGVEI